MNPKQQPGIDFENVYLDSINFKTNRQYKHNKQITLAPGFDYKYNIGKNKGGRSERLFALLSFNPFERSEETPFSLHISIIGLFSASKKSNMRLEYFAKEHAPAHLVPFMREIVANITSRTPYPLILPPVNVLALIKSKKKAAPKRLKYSGRRK